MHINLSEQQKKMLQVRDDLECVEHDRAQSQNGCTVEELEAYLDEQILNCTSKQ